MVIRRIEMVLGMLVAVWGMFVAIYYFKILGFSIFLGVLFGWVLLLQFGIAAATFLDGRDVQFTPLWLWAFTVLLGLTALVGIAIIGVWLLPSVLIALVASVLSLLHDDSQRKSVAHQ